MKSFLTLRLEEETPEIPVAETPVMPAETPPTAAPPKERKPRAKPVPLPPLDEVRSVLVENSGVTYNTVHKALPVSRYQLKKLHAELGMPAPVAFNVRIHVPKERLEQMIALRMRLDHIARELGISNRGLMGVLARHGLKPFDAAEERRKLAEQGLRQCSGCHQTKSLQADFHSYKSDAFGKSVRCKTCSNESQRQFQAKKRAAKAKAADPNPPAAS